MESSYPRHYLKEVARKLITGLSIEDRKYRFKKYAKCFVGKDCVAFMLQSQIAGNVEEALAIGNALLDKHYFHHVCRDHPFKNERLFYRFLVHESHGELSESSENSWLIFLNPEFSHTEVSEPFHHGTLPALEENPIIILTPSFSLPEGFSDIFQLNPDLHEILLDQYNAILLDNSRPPRWRNPQPQKRYTIVAIGSGAGGLVTAAGAASLGATSAIIEKNAMGGDCLNTGCVPSKAVIKCASVIKTIRESAKYGVEVTGMTVNFAKVMERMRRLRAEISYHDSSKRFTDIYGVDVYFGFAKFVDKNTLVVNGEIIHFVKCCIATGGKPRIPRVTGLDEVPYYTSENIFNLTALPPRMVFLGAGPIGCELAQAFARFGSAVTMITNSDKFLPREDRDAAGILEEALVADGITLIKSNTISYVELLQAAEDDWFPVIKCVLGDGITLECECLVLAIGRTPNIQGMDLEAAGVDYTPNGVVIDNQLRTTNSNIYAVGDCCTKYQFTHVADAMARIVLRNALFKGSLKFSDLLIPWCTYTEPEIAHVGVYSHELDENRVPYRTFIKRFDENDRAIVDETTSGFVKIICKGKTDEILGATIVAPQAGEMISEISVAIKNKVGLSKLAGVIHPYPTMSESIKQCGDLFNRTKLTPKVKTLMRMVLKEAAIQ